MTKNFFDSNYVDEKSTEGAKPTSELKKFLKNSDIEEEFKRYGTSKPKRILIKAIIRGR